MAWPKIEDAYLPFPSLLSSFGGAEFELSF